MIKIIKRFLQPIREMKWVWLIGFFVMVNWHVFDLITVIATKEIWEAVQSGETEIIKTIFITYMVYFVISYIVKYMTRTHWVVRTRYVLAKILRQKIYKEYFSFDISSTEKIGTWKMINIISKWIQSRVDMNITIQYSLSDIAVKLLIVWYLLVQLWVVYVIAFVLIFVFLLWLSTWIYDNKVVILRREKKELWVRNWWHMVRMLMSKIEILQINRIQEEIDQYIHLVSEQEQISYRNMKWVFWMFNSSLIAVHAFFPLIIMYVINSINTWTFSYWMFVWLSVAAGTLGQFILKTTDAYKRILDNFIDVEKLRYIIDSTPKITWYEDWKEFSYSSWEVSLKNISFWYEDDSVFKDFSLNIQWKKKTALVGVSWSWKSTLVKLIAWYLRPDRWIVFIDDQDLTSISLKSYYKHIGYLTQEPSVFDGTILDNLTYAIRWNVDQTRLEEIISLAKCDFIRDLPNWIETEIGERWIRLSWGQRQRLAIAKVFLKDPKIIILDEPTSALDSFSEEAITQAMNNLLKDRTVIIIAHRLQTVKNADDIIVLESWNIVERGTHANLVEQWWSYAKMLELQSWF